MANTLLTSTTVTREALRILHEKLPFIGTINRSFDKSFANDGAKIGDTLKVRLPNQYTVRTGATLSAEDTAETSIDLVVATQKGVDVNFTTRDLTLDLDDFSSRILEPAMSVLAADIEADAYSMYKDVYNTVNNDGNAVTFKNIMEGRSLLNKSLAPKSDRVAMLSNDHEVDLVDALKGLFHDSKSVGQQYREGIMGRTGGFDFYENSIVPLHQTGTAAATTGYLVNGASQSGAAITVDTGTTSFLQGDIITIAGVYRVHPETKATTADLQQFVITADSGTSATSLAVSPSLTATGARQNVSAVPADNAAIVKVGAGASETMTSSMVYHKDAFVFATADLIKPKGVHFCAREVLDGISMRVVQSYDINNDKLPCRIDVLYGYKAVRPELAARLHADG